MSGLAAVTGATGFIGRRLTERLVADGQGVRILVRSPDRVPPSLRERVAVVVGDLGRPETVRRAVSGAETVYHLAGLASAWSAHEADYFDVNVEGVRRVLVAAEREGVDRIVHVSTVLTLFPPDGRQTPYETSKRRGERLVQRYVAAGGDAVITHPCRVYGPGPLNDANGATRLIRSFLEDQVSFRLRDGGVRGNWVHVDDVVAGLLLAARNGRAGGHYVLGGENCSVADLLRIAADVAGVRRRCLAVPPAAALCVAGLLELAGRAGAPVPVTRGWVRTFLRDQAVDLRETIDAIDFHPRPLRDGLRETIDWLHTLDGGT